MQLLRNIACWCVFLFLIPASLLAWKENISLRNAFNNYASYYSKEFQFAGSEREKIKSQQKIEVALIHEKIALLKLKCELSDELLSKRIDILVSVLSGEE